MADQIVGGIIIVSAALSLIVLPAWWAHNDKENNK